MKNTTKNTTKKTRAGYDLKTLWGALEAVASGKFHISLPGQNIKLGAIPSFNLLPAVTCAGVCSGCYAIRDALHYGSDINRNSILKAWAENTKTAINDLPALRRYLIDYIYNYSAGINGGRYFRVHASGDFFSREYAQMWADIATIFPGVRFLAFTKQFNNIRGVDFPANFSLVLSGGFGTPIPADLAAKYPIAYAYDGKHGELFPDISALIDAGQIAPAGSLPYIPAYDSAVPVNDFVKCAGNCNLCGACWHLKERGQNVAFIKRAPGEKTKY